MDLDKKWIFKMPVEIRFGTGTVADLPPRPKGWEHARRW